MVRALFSPLDLLPDLVWPLPVIVTVMMDPPRTVLVLVLLVSLVQGLMVMDEPSCQEVEEAECGLCHTVYMEECKMEMVHEMMPKKVSMCRNVTRWVLIRSEIREGTKTKSRNLHFSII